MIALNNTFFRVHLIEHLILSMIFKQKNTRDFKNLFYYTFDLSYFDE